MSYDVSDAEKMQAERSIMALNYTMKLLKVATAQLNIMYVPFKDNPSISPEQILEFRAALRRFRDKAIENFNQFKVGAFKCISLMQMFSSDTQTVKVVKSFINEIEDIEAEVNEFAELFDNLDSKTFVDDIIKNIEAILKECEELENIVNNRLKNHLQTNILGKNWVDGVSDKLQMKIEKQTPIMMELLNKK